MNSDKNDGKRQTKAGHQREIIKLKEKHCSVCHHIHRNIPVPVPLFQWSDMHLLRCEYYLSKWIIRHKSVWRGRFRHAKTHP